MFKCSKTLAFAASKFAVLSLFYVLFLLQDVQGQVIVNDPYTHQVMSGNYYTDVHIYPSNLVSTVGTIRMATGTKIVVHAGGNFIISKGTTITHVSDNFDGACILFWHGIIVYGNPNIDQEQERKIICEDRLVKCTSGGRVGGGKECIGVHGQGIVYADGASIRNANVAISIGDEQNPYEYGTKTYFPSGAKAGGFVYIKNSSFRNNKRAALSFAPYTKHLQQSLIEDNAFVNEFYTSLTLTDSEENFIAAYQNNFKREIEGNTFYNAKPIQVGYTLNDFIKLYESRASIVENKFVGPAHGSHVRGYAWQGFLMPMVLFNNQFDVKSFQAIQMYTVDNANMELNNVAYNTPSTGLPSAITLTLCNTAQIKNNTLKSLSQSGFIDQNGILVSNTNNRTTGLFKNTVEGFPNAVYTLSSNQGTKLECNTFRYSDFVDIFTPAGSQLGPQGSSQRPAGNSFSNSGSSAYYAIKNLGPKYRYFHSNNALQNPSPTMGVIKNLSLRANSCDNVIGYFKATWCPPAGKFDQGGYEPAGTFLRNEYTLWQKAKEEIEQNGIDSSEMDDYQYIRNSYDLELGNLLNHFGHGYYKSDTLFNARYADSISKLLNQHQGFSGSYYLVQWYLSKGDFNMATHTLNQIAVKYEGDAFAFQFCQYMALAIEFASSNYSVSWLNANFPAIKTIADNNSHFMSGQAKVLCNRAAGSDSSNPWYGDTVYALSSNYVIESRDSVSSNTNPELEVNIYPNPFSTSLSVSIKDVSGTSRELHVELVDLFSNPLESKLSMLQPNATETLVFNTSALATAYYMLRVLEGNQVIFTSLVHKP